MSDSADSDESTVEEYPDAVPIQYQKSEQHTTFHASGVRGGVQPSGDFRVDFYTEARGSPDEEEYILDDEGFFEGTVDHSEPPIVRESQATAFMSTDLGLNMAAWIIAAVGDMSVEEVSTVIGEQFEGVSRSQDQTENGEG